MTSFPNSEGSSAVKLHNAGLELFRLVEAKPYLYDFDDTSIEVGAYLTNPDRRPRYEATAQLGTLAVGGFGAMVGKADELLILFPEGAVFDLRVELRENYRGTSVWMRDQKEYCMKMWGGTYVYPDDTEPLIMRYPSAPRDEWSAEEKEAISAIDEMSMLASAGSYVVGLADRAHTLMLADRQ